MSPRAVIAAGANLGDRAATLREAARRLAELGEVEARSALYETAPVGPPQPDYLNAILVLRTTLAPDALLRALMMIERDQGRVRAVKWGPRTLDLDIVDFDGLARVAPGLVLPHPEAHKRAFVLVPLCEVAPELSLSGRSAREWLDALPAGERAGVRRTDEAW